MRTYLISEIGNTHEGSPGLAKCFIRAASECGVDAVKFQTHIFEAESLPDAPDPPYFNAESRKEYLKRTAFDGEQHRELRDFAEKEGVDFISSPFSLEAVDLLEAIGLKMYKIPSGEVTNLPLLEKVGSTGKPVLLSSGMSTWEELDHAVNTLQGAGTRELTLLQCSSVYPCPPEKVGLNVLQEMSRRYHLPVGLSDHTLNFSSSIAAVALGATVIERHFTLSRGMYGSDARHSLEPAELARLVREIRELERSLEHPIDKDALAGQLQDMKVTFEKSIVARERIRKGTKIRADMLAFKKPGDGISAARYGELIGREALRDFAPDEKIGEGEFR